MEMGLAANERGDQTTYFTRRMNFFKVIWSSWYRGKGLMPDISLGSAGEMISMETRRGLAMDLPTG
jgi:hypothetical protein